MEAAPIKDGWLFKGALSTSPLSFSLNRGQCSRDLVGGMESTGGRTSRSEAFPAEPKKDKSAPESQELEWANQRHVSNVIGTAGYS